MPRALPFAVPVPVGLPTVKRPPLFELRIEVVTPMFGGGAEPRAADPLAPIRGAAIRGQLRFWWRACNAHRFTTAAQLFAEENAVWGSTSKQDDETSGPTPIAVRVELVALAGAAGA